MDSSGATTERAISREDKRLITAIAAHLLDCRSRSPASRLNSAVICLNVKKARMLSGKTAQTTNSKKTRRATLLRRNTCCFAVARFMQLVIRGQAVKAAVVGANDVVPAGLRR